MTTHYPELEARVQAFKQHIQEFRCYLETLPNSNQQQIERSLTTVQMQLETLLARDSAALICSHASIEQWSAVSDYLPFGIFCTDAMGNCTYINPRCEEMIGYTLEQSLDQKWHRFIHSEDRDRVLLLWRETLPLGKSYVNQFRILTPPGKLHWLSIRTNPIFSELGELKGHIGAIEDITAQKLAEEQIKFSLDEKEALLKEIHHRVKNNLQIISSLIYLQAQRIHDPALRQVFEESQSRISSMALVHDILYRSQNLAYVNLSEYVQTLTSSLFHTYRTQIETVHLNVQVDPNIVVNSEKAIPCGLILNELITNALKHGFSGGETGEVTVILENHSPKVCLIVENGGKILPGSFELQKIRTMGLRLVNALTNQLNGQVSVETTQKTRFKVTFDLV